MEIFDSKFRNPGNFCLWNPESGKFLLLESRIREIFGSGIRIKAFGMRNPATRIGNPANDWNSESKTVLGWRQRERTILNRNNIMKSTTGPGTDPCGTPKHLDVLCSLECVQYY